MGQGQATSTTGTGRTAALALAAIVLLAGCTTGARPDLDRLYRSWATLDSGRRPVVVTLAYTFLALRRVYREGRLRTAFKLAALFVAYLPALVATMLFTLFLTTLTI